MVICLFVLVFFFFFFFFFCLFVCFFFFFFFFFFVFFFLDSVISVYVDNLCFASESDVFKNVYFVGPR